MSTETLRVHQFIPESRSNGPGTRAVLWVQGCSLACPGCFNPETHSPHQGEPVETIDLLERIASLEHKIEGLTVSGGEPFQQSKPIARLLKSVRGRTHLSIIVFTGFNRDELPKIRYAADILDCVDVLVAGRFELKNRIAKHLTGSTNKEIVFLTNRYTMADLEQTPAAEVLIHPNGEVDLTGIDPITWQTPKIDQKS